ncbi:MAG: hypothetical protein H0V82_01675 [Candidatus Protochlamydia sp.]|nr:hypothetical protein [Candidatus Protochlamydia sp.]
MNDITPLEKIQNLTQELEQIKIEMQSSTNAGRNYEIIHGKLSEHSQKIQDICQECMGQIDFTPHLTLYTEKILEIRNFLPKLLSTSDKITTVAYMKGFSIQKKLNEAKIINEIILTFNLSESTIREMIPENSTKGFFVDIANVCFGKTKIK